MGTYYERRNSNYVVVNAPIGATISILPDDSTTVIIDGVSYYTYNGTYYLRSDSGYIVVPEPEYRQPVVEDVTSGQVIVTSPALNVRSGPSTSHSVVGKLREGHVVKILGNAMGWYYIQLPDGRYGWIMAKYTVPYMAEAEG